MARLLHPRILGALALVALAGAALGAFALASPGAADDGVFEIRLGDGAIEVERATLPHGPQVIEAVNAGGEEHEVVVVRTRLPAGEIPVGLHGVAASSAGKLVIGEDHLAAGHRHEPSTILGLRPGTSRRFQIELRRGAYVALCQTDNHYLEGERTGFEVR